MAKPDYPILTERLALRPFTPGDLDALHSWESRPDVARFRYWEARTREEVREALAVKMSTTWPEGGATPWSWQWCARTPAT